MNAQMACSSNCGALITAPDLEQGAGALQYRREDNFYFEEQMQ